MLLWYSGDAAKIHYAVLAVVSNCCPPLKGRLLTCYSPVRHCSGGASSPFTVRLACVRRAASVRPEPGSNSLKFVLNRPSGRFNLLYINASVNFSTLLFAYPEFSFLIFRALPSASPSPLPLSSKRRIDKVMLIRSFLQYCSIFKELFRRVPNLKSLRAYFRRLDYYTTAFGVCQALFSKNLFFLLNFSFFDPLTRFPFGMLFNYITSFIFCPYLFLKK